MTSTRDLDWADLRVLTQLAATGTARAAGAALKMHHSTIGRRLRALEIAVGARLVERTPDGYALTQAGDELVAAAQVFEDDLQKIGRRIDGMDSALEGSLTVTMAEPLATAAFAPRLAEFADAYPGLELRFITSFDRLDMARREADVAVRMDNNPPETLVGKRLFPFFQTAYATPDYLARTGVEATPEAGRWLRWDQGAERFPVWARGGPFEGTPAWGCFPDLALQQSLARQGFGLALLPCLLGDRDPALVRAGGTAPTPGRDIWILTHADLRRSAKVRAFATFAERVLRDLKAEITGAMPSRA